jgi:hypothetical protein
MNINTKSKLPNAIVFHWNNFEIVLGASFSFISIGIMIEQPFYITINLLMLYFNIGFADINQELFYKSIDKFREVMDQVEIDEIRKKDEDKTRNN